MEVWLPVNGYPGYFVSNYGRVKSTRRNREKILKKSTNWYGIEVVGLYADGAKKPHTMAVHRLVLTAFVGAADGLDACHLNGDKVDNHLSNLKWVKRSESPHRKKK